MRRLVLLSWLGLSACSTSPGESSGTGGTSPTSGGSTSSGGAITSGGAATQGGAATSSGGAITSGGAATQGGAATSSGGAITSGGAATQGGASGATSGGTAGSGGSAGAGTSSGGGGGSTGGGSGGPCTAPGITFCSDFEADTLPTALVYYPEYQRAMMSNWVTVNSTVAHSGTRSVKVNGTDFSQMLGVPTPAATFWGRVYLRSETDIQMGHNTYVNATDGSGDPNDGIQIRIGEHQCQLEVNRNMGDTEKLSNGGTYTCDGGNGAVKFVANTWYCLEFFYDGPNSGLQVFVDRNEITNLKVSDWGPYQYKLFKFGFEKYHGGNKVLYYDDVAIGTQRVGCF